ncbi:MAG: hypothetical protein IKR69_06595 [Bacteroidales bacterium]|nr:hypothetical protein [Bacteroidales bacterium]
MKKKYFVPEVEEFQITLEGNILSNGENLNIRSYDDDGLTHDEDDFWS